MRFPFDLLSAAEFDVTGFGTNAVDHLIQVEEYPAFDSKVRFTSYEREPGGEVASTLVGLQRLGCRTAYVGRFGDDENGEIGRRSLDTERVDTTYTETVAGAATQTAFIIIDRASGERTIIWDRDEKLAYRRDEAPLEAAARCKILHLTAHDPHAAAAMARQAKQSGALVSLDIDNFFDGIDELLPVVDILIASADLPEKLTGSTDRADALREIKQRYGCPIVGATLGAEGSIFLCNDMIVETGGFAVPGGCIDTTGAGDAFRAGFLCGILSGEEVEQSARIANAVAALKCRKLGARAGLPTFDELTMFIKNL